MILDLFRVTGRVAVVTGAGRGIGAAAAIALAQAGADVVISARTADQLAAVADEVAAAGRRAVTVPADLSDLDAAAGLAATAVEEFGRLDIVVNNVGGAMPRPFLATKPRHLVDAFGFNVAVAHSLTKAAVPHLLAAAGPASGTSAVVDITSTVGRVAGRGYLAYGTAKAAERGLNVRFEVADALNLGQLGLTFDTAIDSGLFHVFDDEARARYVASLASVLRSGGSCHLMCFSDLQEGTLGPRRVRKDELISSFSDGWTVTGIEAEEFVVNRGLGIAAARAWLATIRRQ